MIIRVEGCWSGRDKHSWRLTAPDGRRAVLPHPAGASWSRKYASRAIDLLMAEKIITDRRQARFYVV